MFSNTDWKDHSLTSRPYYLSFIFAEYLGSVSAAAPENPFLLFISIERSIRDADGTKVLIAFYERPLD